jgi:hypothetical protein
MTTTLNSKYLLTRVDNQLRSMIECFSRTCKEFEEIFRYADEGKLDYHFDLNYRCANDNNGFTFFEPFFEEDFRYTKVIKHVTFELLNEENVWTRFEVEINVTVDWIFCSDLVVFHCFVNFYE